MKGKDDSMCRKKVVKKFLIVGLLLSIILVNKNVVYAEKQAVYLLSVERLLQ